MGVIKKIVAEIKQKRIPEKIGYMIKIVLAIPVSVYMKRRLTKKSIWLIGIQYDRYENNCKELYEFLTTKNENVFWVLNKKSKSLFLKYISENKMILRGSIKNYVYAINARVAAYSASDYDVAPGLYRIIGRRTCLINLSHGYDSIKKMESDYYRLMPSDMIICASEYEKMNKVKNCSAPIEKTFVTGFARCDNFIVKRDEGIDEIMVMPTWRPWYIENGFKFENSGIYINYKELLTRMDSEIDSGIKITFLLHPRMADYFSDVKINDFGRIEFVYEQNRINEVIRRADLLITDYSSIAFDFFYMNKPVIFFWFDEEEYRKNVGISTIKLKNICLSVEETIAKAKNIIHSETSTNSEMRERYFDFFDNKNCERIYNAIKNHKKYIDFERVED